MNTKTKADSGKKKGSENSSKKAVKTPEKSSGNEIPLIEYADLMDTEETARFLHISVDTLYKWIEKGIIPHYKLTGKKILFNKRKLSQWLEGCEVC